MSNETGVRDAPTTVGGIFKELGPGLIIAGSIVGSGELIATTLTGAEAGFWLIWLILIGCVIKVFVQLEIGRYTITTGHTALEGLSRLPGRKPMGIHWAVWLWLVMFVATVGQYGGIVGAVGQSIGITAPLTQEGRAFNEAADLATKAKIAAVIEQFDEGGEGAAAPQEVALPDPGMDVYYWAILMTLVTCVILYRGKYNMIEKTVMILVGGFTVLSMINVIMLQINPVWAVKWSDIGQGFSFRLPPPEPGLYPVATALATFGIIGMAAGELIYYPYWCLEKGYAKHIGPPEDSEEWRNRAKGWIRVMRWDAWLSMVVYTVSTLVFYILGAAVLSRAGLRPEGSELIRTLSAMYEPVFGEFAVGLFLVGSVAVLYSTFFVGSASMALVASDAAEIVSRNWKRSLSRIKARPFFNIALPLIAFVIFVFLPNPKVLVLVAGITNTFMLPILGFAALYYRYRCTGEAFKPRPLWDVFLWLSALALLLVGLWLASRLLGLS